MARELRVCWLYPDLLSINGDRGNLVVLRRRCEWRGIGFRLEHASLGDRLAGPFGLVYLGGGQDVAQRRAAVDLVATKADDLRSAAAVGTVVLGVIGGFQLLGRSVDTGAAVVEGAGLVDVTTVRGDERLIGDTVVEVDLGGGRVLAGYENHAGRTTLGPGVEPLGHVRAGPGNDGRSGLEGVRCGTVLGTYLRGPLLLANAWFADELIALALGAPGLEPLDDALEEDAHQSFLRRVSVAAP
jgi:lipid II isoglutaminyl synthase (glutamine-hydrolysing)